MSKKQFDHIEDRIREAAENSEVSFDALAWQKMEAKLDKEKGTRRRFFAWWIVAAILISSTGIAGYFILTNTAPKKITVTGKVAKNESVVNDKLSNSNKNTIQNKDIVGAADKLSRPLTDQLPGVATGKIINTAPAKNIAFASNKDKSTEDKISLVKAAKKVKTSKQKEYVAAATNTEANDKLNSRQTQLSGKTKGKTKVSINSNNVADIDAGNDIDQKNNSPVINSALPKNDTDKLADINVENTKKNVTVTDTIRKDKELDSNKISTHKPGKNNIAESTKKQPEKTIHSRFYLLASVGADAAGLKLFSIKSHTIAPKFGIGAGYELNSKISLQTGFYASRKKYIAGPDDYNAKDGSYWSMVKLLKVDASCLVYEIPLAVRYNILQKNSFTLFATGGISSFIMKKEDYDYHYIHDNVYHEMAKSYTGNKNFFSIASLSAGLEKRVSPAFSIIAEPSVSMPLTGVGDGRVKLFSTALQLGFKYQPLKKNRKK